MHQGVPATRGSENPAPGPDRVDAGARAKLCPAGPRDAAERRRHLGEIRGPHAGSPAPSARLRAAATQLDAPGCIQAGEAAPQTTAMTPRVDDVARSEALLTPWVLAHVPRKAYRRAWDLLAALS